MQDFNCQDVDILSKIKKLKKAKGMTWEVLAKKSGIPETTIKSWYVRNTEPSISDLRSICVKAFHITLWEFFYHGSFEKELKEVATVYEKTWMKLPDEYRGFFLMFVENIYSQL